MPDLEDAARLVAADHGGLLPVLASAAAQLREASTQCGEGGWDRLGGAAPRTVLVLAAGSVPGGPAALAAAAVGTATRVPVLTGSLDDALAPWVGALDVVLVASADGAAGSAAVLDDALHRGAATGVVAPAGSPLAERAGREPSVPLLRLGADRCHPGALWSQLVPLVVAAVQLGLPGPVSGELEETALRLEAVAQASRVASEVFLNPAKELALTLDGRVPVLWASSPVAQAAAGRLVRSLREWAGLPALISPLGEGDRLLDGAFGGALGAADLFADPFLDGPGLDAPRLQALLVRDDPGAEPADAAARCAALEAAAEQRGVRVASVSLEGASRLERLASLALVGDFAAAYLALMHGRDPLAAVAGVGPG